MDILRIKQEKHLQMKYYVFYIAKYPKYDGYQRDLASMVYNFFDKKYASLTDKCTKGNGFKSAIKQNQQRLDWTTKQLAEKLDKAITRKA